MNIQEVLDKVDERRPNSMRRTMKINLIQTQDQKIYEEILLTHWHRREEEVMPHYSDDSDAGTELLVPERYGDVYVYWLLCHIDEQNREMGMYNNDRVLFENAYGEMQDWWNRRRMPLSRNRQLWI